MNNTAQKNEKETLSESFIKQMLGESIMSGSSVRPRNDWSLAMILEVLKTDGVHQAAEVARHLVSLHPNSIDVLVKLYMTLKNEFGLSKMAREIAFIYSKTKREQMESLVDFSRTPPLHTPGWMLKRVGEMVEQTAGVVRANQLGLLKYKPVLLLTDREAISNSAFWPYLNDAFEIISDQRDAQSFLAQPVVPRLDTYLMHFSDNIFGHSSEYNTSLFELINERELPLTAFKLKDSTATIAQNFLRRFGLRSDDLFVTLHIREEGYVDHSTHADRNSRPHDFQDSVDHLVQQGVKVVRIGHSKMTPMREQDGFIDLSRTERPSEVDIYLCAKNWFYFGSSSGPLSISLQFGRPSLLIDFFPHGIAQPNTLHLLKRFSSIRNSNVLSLRELEEMDLETVFSADVFKKREIEALGTPPEDIKNATLDMLTIGPDNILDKNFDSSKFSDLCQDRGFKALFSKRSSVA